MKPKYYELLSRAIMEGVATGLRRARKHDDDPTEESMRDALEMAIMNAICEVFDFDGVER